MVPPLNGARVVLVNWRDRGHPLAGGAEEYAARMADAMTAAGATVTFLTARGKGQDSGDGTTVRRGGRWTVYLWALLWLLRNRRRIDVVVDCQNGIPFFSPVVVSRRTKVVLVMHHVHDKQFDVHFPPWLARVGRWLEGPAARWVYRRAMTVAVSESTVRAMRDRLAWRGPISVVHNGMDQPAEAEFERSVHPSIVCLGRLVTHKRVDRLIDIVGGMLPDWPTLRLHVIGTGPEEAELRSLAARFGDAVLVHGFVDDETKAALLRDSWLNVTLSDGEGWGLAVIEAAAHGLPTVCRRVDGLCDSVRHGETGWLVGPDDDLTGALHDTLKLLSRPEEAEIVGKACRDWAARFDWVSSGHRFVAVVTDLLYSSKPGRANGPTSQEDLCDAR
ncbi:glycosyltransferase family 1 protein [Kibdelosporangium aridum]|uniref:Glycosyltransferase family 1 protein n=1 Tax=Kibdelosporangium aridum TaxID=2030 RepID=A0A428YC86_KIBAR|nr:glycosyltransferase family 4 protein [Kibdelosporangium aridum]RSM65168.1 glycosyltransferase family 1 protein [Kibdelosporangium aridum]